MKNLPFNLQNVVVAMDLSDTDQSIASYVNFFAHQFPVKKVHNVHLFTAQEFYQHVSSHGTFSEENPLLKEALMKRLKEEVEVGEVYKSIDEVSYEVLVGSAAGELMRYVKEKEADLLVLGKKKHGAGILAKNAIRRIHCNALVVPEKAEKKLARILVPIDLSEHSGKALQTAMALTQAAKYPIELTGLYIYEMPTLSPNNLMRFSSQFYEYVKENTGKAIQAFLDQYIGQGHPKVESVLLEERIPNISHHILDFAEKNHVDLIVMGTRGRSGLDAFFLGSVAERVLSRNDRTPTLVVK